MASLLWHPLQGGGTNPEQTKCASNGQHHSFQTEQFRVILCACAQLTKRASRKVSPTADQQHVDHSA
jgi:hypothetical protein